MEEVLREQQETHQVLSMDNFYKLDFYDEKTPVTYLPVEYNKFPEFERYKKKEDFTFEEFTTGKIDERNKYFIEQV